MNTTLILFRPSLSSLHLSPCSYSIPSQIHNLFFCNILLHIDFEWKTNPPGKLQGTKICQSLSPSSFPEDKVTFLTAVAIYLQIKVRKKGLFSPDSLRVQPTLVERYYSKNMSQLVLLWSVRKKMTGTLTSQTVPAACHQAFQCTALPGHYTSNPQQTHACAVKRQNPKEGYRCFHWEETESHRR